MIAPFLLGFDFPDSAGTYVNASAGAGHYRFTPACSRYTYGSGFQEGGVTVQHRIATPAPKNELVRSPLVPAFITFSAGGDLIHRRTTVLSIDDTPDFEGDPPFVPPEGWPVAGFDWDRMGWAGRAKIGFDWKWIGTEIGASWMDYRHGRESEDSAITDETVGVPVIGLRLGDAEGIYFMAEFMESNPIITGGGYAGFGIGIKAGSTRMSYGITGGPIIWAPLKLAQTWTRSASGSGI